jgi:hypothetical protein
MPEPKPTASSNRRQSRSKPHQLCVSTPEALDRRTYDSLCDLHACVLALDAERRRVASILETLSDPNVVPLERAQLERRHAELTEELAALRGMIERLRASVDPESRFL